MRESQPVSGLWIGSLLTAASGPLVAYCAAECGWSAGAMSLGVGGATGLAALLAARTLRAGQRKVRALEDTNRRLARELRTRSRDEGAGPPGSSALAGEAAAWQPTDDDPVNYALLLLTIQDIGRRVAMNLDLDSLVPTIVSSAKASLRCGRCDVYLWNAREQSLHNALPPAAGDRASAPDPRRGAARWVLDHRQILTRDMAEHDDELQALLEHDAALPHALAPLSVGGELLGLLAIDQVQHDNGTFARLLYVLSDLYALGLKNAQLFKRIEEMARRDGLTGLLNHASFQQELERLAQQAAGGGGSLTVIMSDLDHFKKLNDTYRHQAGDHVLRETAALWRAVLPDTAVIGRYGGEEFICALPRDDLDRATELAELLRRQIETYVFDFEGWQLRVTASFGIAQLGRPAQTAHELIRLADEGLYAAKATGRNRVVRIPCGRDTWTGPAAQPRPTGHGDSTAPPQTKNT